MRRIVNSPFVSRDVVVNHMDRWHFDFIDEDLEALALEQVGAGDALLLGRNTYDIYATAWPGRDGEMADLINAMPKYVASSTKQSAEWITTIISGDVVEAVTALKREDGKN